MIKFFGSKAQALGFCLVWVGYGCLMSLWVWLADHATNQLLVFLFGLSCLVVLSTLIALLALFKK